MLNPNAQFNIGQYIWPFLYFALSALLCFGLWMIRGRQPGNTRYSVAIYAGMGGCLLLIILGLFFFGIV